MLYEEANRKYHNCQEIISDNLVKQAKTIVKPNVDEFDKWLKSQKIDYMEATYQDMELQINETRSKDLMNSWNDIRRQYLKDKARLDRVHGNEGATDADNIQFDLFEGFKEEDLDLYLKDQLFIETGEDVEDIFLSFKVHKLAELDFSQLNDNEGHSAIN